MNTLKSLEEEKRNLEAFAGGNAETEFEINLINKNIAVVQGKLRDLQ